MIAVSLTASLPLTMGAYVAGLYLLIACVTPAEEDTLSKSLEVRVDVVG